MDVDSILEDSVKAIKVEDKNLGALAKIFNISKDNIKVEFPRTASDVKRYVIIEENGRGFVIKEGCMVIKDPKQEDKIIILPRNKNSTGGDFYAVQKV